MMNACFNFDSKLGILNCFTMWGMGIPMQKSKVIPQKVTAMMNAVSDNLSLYLLWSCLVHQDMYEYDDGQGLIHHLYKFQSRSQRDPEISMAEAANFGMYLYH